jgi:flagellar protein FlgJ
MEGIAGFKEKLRGVANAVQKETGISARLGVAQAALESAYGGSELSRPTAKLAIQSTRGPLPVGPANNLFGFKTGEAWIKAGNAYVMIATKDYYKAGQKMPDGNTATKDGQALVWPAPFRAYPSWDASYRDWARLMQIPMYVNDGALAALKADNLDAFGKALSIHYAPNQSYDKRLLGPASNIGSMA